MKPKLTVATLLAVAVAVSTGSFFAQSKKPNILIIWGDVIGWYNQRIYYRGDMEYWTPNSDALHDRVQEVTSAN